MSRVKRPRLSTEPDRTSTAAYAASQPLFSTLKNATVTVDSQKAGLTTARDVVQQLHVKIDTGDAERHEAYMQNVVSAWEAATEAYCKVFEELCNVTRADDSEGRPPRKRHEEFAKILETARRARDAVKDYAPAKVEEGDVSAAAEKDDFSDEVRVETTSKAEKVSQTNGKKRKLADAEPLPDAYPHQRADQSDEDEIIVKHTTVPTKTAPPAQVTKAAKTKTPPQKSLLDDTIRYSRLDPTKIIWENGKLRVPFERLSPDERKAWTVIKQRQKRLKTRTKIKSNRAEGPSAAREDAEAKQEVNTDKDAVHTQDDKPGSSVPTPTPANGQDESVPVVEYEDVSAEVEARLKAKAEKKAQEKAKKSEKKRKRESKDSFVNPGAEIEDPEAVPEGEADSKDKAAKPAKKKSKKSADSGVSTNGAPTDDAMKVKKAPRKIQKRKNVVEEEDGDEIKVAAAPAKQSAKKRTRHF
ncbi:hypothetical protein CLAFUW4_03637 [Fulvia fulva]|uniref:Uncharacterized protein n=1 Tax=Passalora fulva TaxID=5499 RepID=A0A9Q8P5T1_PASFU|nr:uncharacterized protein CLAFUR5_03615 [Fulvia fulva]KAK4632363.1 hypothetical protein CLAFUR4_03625 [Fulvia fulva]KAK4633290.1 hypothetical protein CLAFUR0_03628 [Fulvia fulva]UJO14072.1 hypothetical protein CLAFUR5_03615 [Fulvia fulva]WPV11660.1 hypothetical protein CLAFUW4_03637 [Fulvia fulva]WPV26221.1 hypothetical protein CLAFUW7_03629 [Fulvia fulva]